MFLLSGSDPIIVSVCSYGKLASEFLIEHAGKSQKRNQVQNKNKQRQVNERNKLLGKY